MMNLENTVRINRKKSQAGIIQFEPVLRINRKNKNQGAAFVRESTKPTLKSRNLTNIKEFIFAVIHSISGHIDNHCLEVVLTAQMIANQKSTPDHQVAVLVICAGKINETAKKNLTRYGGDQIALIDYEVNQVYAPHILVGAIKRMIDDYQPCHTFFAESELFGAEILRWLIVQFDFSFATDIHQISYEKIYRFVENERTEIQFELTELIGLKKDVAKGELPYLCEGELIENESVKNANEYLKQELDTSHFIKINQLDFDFVNLEESKFIASAGNGVSDINQFIHLSKLLKASIGGSRVVVDDGKLPRDKQIGLTGRVVQSQVYLALGISGAIQHLQGIENCQYVIAVNKDASCPMIKRSNLAVIADLDEFIPEMIHQVKKIV